MPPRVPIPYVREQFDRSHSVRRLSDLNRRSADAAADLELRQGDISANLGMTLAQLAGNVGSAIAEGPERQRRAEAEQMRLDATRADMQARTDARGRESAIRDVTSKVPPTETGATDWKKIAEEVRAIDPVAALDYFKVASAEEQAQIAGEAKRTDALARLVMTTEADMKKMAPPQRQERYAAARLEALQAGLAKPEEIPEQYSPAFMSRMRAQIEPLDTLFKRMETAGGEGFTLSPGQQRFGPEGGEPIANVPEKVTPPAPFTLGPGATRYGPDGKPIASVPAAPREPGADPLVAVIKDGKSVLVPRSEAVGMTPASSREQGRPVISGDANKIADFDTALDDLNVLTRDLGITGTSSKVGAMMPNWVTDLTGWGADSKSRQAVIDRVKQVIGKALEGGVLRKEDEIKYEKILPTIGDNSVVAKAKLQGLWESIQQRRSTTIDSLSDAGYDTSRFSARAPRTQGGVAPPAGSAGPITVTTPDGQTFTFPNQAAADGFKKRAGIP